MDDKHFPIGSPIYRYEKKNVNFGGPSDKLTTN